MTDFIQIHMLTFYPASNLNRDDLGRPKTVVIGNTQRLRVSSQSLKRAWRTSDLFKAALSNNIGKRTKEKGEEIREKMKKGGIDEKNALEWSRTIIGVFGKVEKESAKLSQLVHFSPEELAGIDKLVDEVIQRKKGPKEAELNLLRKDIKAVDIGLFGRMLADNPAYNIEAAAQVAHAFTVHKVTVEDDYFSAVDDLNQGLEHKGSAHIGNLEFGAGLFYTYICINSNLLLKNLQGDKELTRRTLMAFAEAAAKVSPRGKQNSFASHGYASYILAERGNKQPRSLAVAFLKSIDEQNDHLVASAKKSLLDVRKNIDKTYGKCWEQEERLDAISGEGSMEKIKKFVGKIA